MTWLYTRVQDGREHCSSS